MKTRLARFSARRMRTPSALAAAVLTALLCAHVEATAPAGDIEPAFDVASQLYEAGQFSEAAAAYERLLQSGASSPALYFNWGNAQFKAGRIGHAIAAYRMAEQLAPRDPDVRTNLRFAREQVQGPTLRAGWQARLPGTLSLKEWTLTTAIAWWVWFALLVARQLRPAARRSLRGLTWAATLILLLSAAGLGWNLRERFSRQVAIVVADDVAVRNGPFDESPTAFTVRDGAELRMLDQKENWLQVQAGERRIGWLPRQQVLLLPAR